MNYFKTNCFGDDEKRKKLDGEINGLKNY